MSLIVEDGSGLTTSESYISVADADTYHDNRGNTAWDAINDDAKEQLLRKATDYLEQTYRLRWSGVRVFPMTQALSWPRALPYPARALYWPPVGMAGDWAYVDNKTVPNEVKRACAELALRANAGDLKPDLQRTALAETVGQVSVYYESGAPELPRYPIIDEWLAPYLSAQGGIAVVRG